MESVIIFNRQISMYGLMIVVGILFGLLISYFLIKKYKFCYFDYLIGFVYCVLFGFLGAKILYLIIGYNEISWNLFFRDYSYFISNIQGGFVFYGGLFGAGLGAYIAHKIHGINSLKIISLVVPTFPLMHGFGRIGCHCVGCCFGIPSLHNFLSVTYYSPNHPMRGIPLFPVQLLEAGLNFFLSIFLFYYLKKKGVNNKNIFVYLIGYSIIRFITEFFRYDEIRGVFKGISTSQYISFTIILISIFYLYIILQLKNKNERSSEDGENRV